MKNMKRYAAFLMALLMLAGLLSGRDVSTAFAAGTDWPEAPEITAEAAVVMELSTGNILYQKNAHVRHFPASTTKIMTALLALENSSLDEMVEYTEEAVYGNGYNSSSIGMTVGEHLSMENSLYGLMLASANEVAKAIAIHVGGSLEGFADMMNARAAEIGCTDTHFVTPNGLHDENHYTTAIDMAKIAREAAKNETFLKIAGTKYYVIPPTAEREDSERPVSNTHLMINPLRTNAYLYEPAYAGKTGYTTEAGYPLVTYAKVDDLDVVCVIMHGYNRESQYTSGITMLENTFENFAMTEVSASDILDAIPKNDVLLLHLAEEEGYDGYTDVPISVRLAYDKIPLPKDADLSECQIRVKYENGMYINPGENVIGTVTVRYASREVETGEILFESERGDSYAIPPHTGSRTVDPDGTMEGEDLSVTDLPEDAAGAELAAERMSAGEEAAKEDAVEETAKNADKSLEKGVPGWLIAVGVALAVVAAGIIVYEVKIGIPYREKRKIFLEKEREYEEYED